jgi:hypothetical protein
MIATFTVLLLVILGQVPTGEPPEPAPGDGLGLTTNRPRSTPGPRSKPPSIPLPGVGLGGLAALAGLAGGWKRNGGRRKGATGEAFDGDLDAVWGLAGSDEVLLLDPRGDGRFAIRLGPPDADYVAILVPGTGVGLGDAQDYVTRIRNIHQSAERYAGSATVATILALPFDAPDQILTNPSNVDCACNSEKARRGAVALTEFIADLDLDARRVTVIGHSYGSTVVGAAFAYNGLGAYANTPVFLGSPGVLVHHADQLDALGEVYAAQAPFDFIDGAGVWPVLDTVSFRGRPNKDLLIHGVDPTAPQFGAIRIPAGGTGHSSYFFDQTTLRSLGLIITGKDPLAPRPWPRRVQPYAGGRAQ